MSVETDKRLVAQSASQLVEDGMRVGLGTGSTVAFLLEAIASRAVKAVYVASSPRTEVAARALGLCVEPFDSIDRLDLAIDGADQVGSDGWLIKGGGGVQKTLATAGGQDASNLSLVIEKVKSLL